MHKAGMRLHQNEAEEVQLEGEEMAEELALQQLDSM
jgi:hypothetical protein